MLAFVILNHDLNKHKRAHICISTCVIFFIFICCQVCIDRDECSVNDSGDVCSKHLDLWPKMLTLAKMAFFHCLVNVASFVHDLCHSLFDDRDPHRMTMVPQRQELLSSFLSLFRLRNPFSGDNSCSLHKIKRHG